MRSSTYRFFSHSLVVATLATVGCTGWLILVISTVERFASPVLVSPPPSAPNAGPDVGVNSLQLLDQLPVTFEPNRGQWDQQVAYRMRSVPWGGYEVELRREGPRIIFESAGKIESLDLRFQGSAGAVEIEAADPSPAHTNYFIGSSEADWITSLPGYHKIIYRLIYPGIDLVLYGRGHEIEFDFLVAAGADPSLIQMAFIRTESGPRETRSVPVELAEDGELRFPGWEGVIELGRPHIYQESPAGQQTIDGGYHISNNSLVTFELGSYDPTHPLVIDPLIVSSGFLGGTGQDTPYAITHDDSGNIYLAGQTRSTNFPVRSPYDGTINGVSDAFLMKINPSGTAILMSTYLGGRNPGDRILDIEVDRDGLIYVCGETSSLNFPLVNPFQSTYSGNFDGFVAILGSGGSRLLFSSLLGGSSQDTIYGLALDEEHNIYLTGSTRSGNFPTVRAMQPQIRGEVDAFVAKVDPRGKLLFATYWGGQDTGVEESEEESGLGIVVDPLRNIYLTGVTSSNAFPLVAPYQSTFGGVTDCFVVKMGSDGQSVIFSTYLGGVRADAGRAIVVDPFGQSVITGYTFFRDFPVKNAFQPAYMGNLDAFVTKMSANGQRLIFSSFLGGSGEENSGAIGDSTPVGSIAIDRAGYIYVGGKTSSSDFPLLVPIQPGLGGDTDGFVSKIDPAGTSLLFSSYIGGSSFESSGSEERVTGLSVDERGLISLTGITLGGNFPVVLPFQSIYGGGVSDGFLSLIATPDVNPATAVSAASFNGGVIAPGSIVALFGSNFATGQSTAPNLPLPELLGGTRVQIEDQTGLQRSGGLFFVSPEQINLYVPEEILPGPARLNVFNSFFPDGLQRWQQASIQVERVAPAIFTANADGAGAPAAIIQRVRAGAISYEPVAEVGQFGYFEPRPIDLGPESDEVYLILFGTGWRGAASISDCVVKIGGLKVPVLFAGAQGNYVGLDQLNLRLPRELIGSRSVNVTLEVEGMIANVVRLYVL